MQEQEKRVAIYHRQTLPDQQHGQAPDAPGNNWTGRITYLTNNADRMRYNEYRKKGLPITTSRVESTQKQINGRFKGTEKFWNDESLETVLQLVSDDLSDNFDPEAFWNRRQQRFNGYRERSPRRKTETVKS